jgi:hypothetical protein
MMNIVLGCIPKLKRNNPLPIKRQRTALREFFLLRIVTNDEIFFDLLATLDPGMFHDMLWRSNPHHYH